MLRSHFPTLRAVRQALVVGGVALLAACRPSAPVPAAQADEPALLRIEQADSFTLVSVMDAWRPGHELQRLVLVPRERPLPAHLPEGVVVRTPLRRAAVFSAVHAALLCDLGCEAQVVGLADAQYALRPDVRAAVESGRWASLGSSVQPALEVVAAVHPDALLVSPFENGGHGALEVLGVPVVECADYMEPTALGRAAWVRLLGLLFGCDERADSLLSGVRARYDSLRTLAAEARERPRLLVDTKQGSAWYVPGGRSYLARLYADAGADYVFAHEAEAGSVAMAPEAVFAQGRDADLWLVKYGARADLSYEQMAADYPASRAFRPWRERRVYACNTLAVPYYEEVPFHPDRLLADFVHIFHPELLPAHRLRYFKPLGATERRPRPARTPL